MNNNFNVRLLIGAEGLHSEPEFLNSCLKRVSARMVRTNRTTSAKTIHVDTAMEGFRLFFGSYSLGSSKLVNPARLIMEELLRYESQVRNGNAVHAALLVSFLGEHETFKITEFSIVSINADQTSSYVEYEVRVILAQS